MSTTPNTPRTPATDVPDMQAWTFVGHWDQDRIVIEYVLPGEVEDDREDDGYFEQGLWSAAGWGRTQDEARRNVIAEYEGAIHGDEDEDADGAQDTGNPAYPNGRCDACGWGLNAGCANPDCERPGTKLPAEDDDEDEDSAPSTRYVSTFTFDAADDRDAAGLIASLASAIDDSDALPVYDNASLTSPRAAKTWPETDADRDDFAAWQHDVANGDTLRGFRDWQAELAADRDD